MAKRILVVTQHFWPENFRINDIVEGFLQDGLEVDVLCGLPNYPKGNGSTATVNRAPGRNTMAPLRCSGPGNGRAKAIPARHLFELCKLAPLCPGRCAACRAGTMRYSASTPARCSCAGQPSATPKSITFPFTNYVLDLWPENLYSVLPVKNNPLLRASPRVSATLYISRPTG